MLVMYTGPACGPCKMMYPTIEKLKDERGYEVEYVDISENVDEAIAYGVMATPTFILLDELGNELRRAVGAMTRPNLIKFVEGE